MREKFLPTGPLPVTELLLDQGNYRLGPLESQTDCINMMFEEFGGKIENIAKHIAENGLSPDHIVVLKNEQGHWVVRDGNRRITALKLLNNPAEAPEAFRSKFEKIKSKFEHLGHIVPEVECTTSDKDTIIQYMILTHEGEQEGIGHVDWDTRAKDNLLEDAGGKPKNQPAREICAYLVGKKITEADKAPITTIQRLFQDRAVQKRVGISWDGKNLGFIAKESEVFEVLKEIILDFASRGKKVQDVFTDINRQGYLDELFTQWGLKEPSPDTSPTGTGTPPSGGGGCRYAAARRRG